MSLITAPIPPSEYKGVFQSIYDLSWTIFGPFVRWWVNWISDLESKQEGEEKALGSEQKGNKFEKIKNTAQGYIDAFEILNIGVVNYVLKEKKLPDPAFVRKNYLDIQKLVHPDRGGTTDQATRVNLAYEKVNELYDDINLQILFLGFVSRRPGFSAIGNNKGPMNSSPYIFLFLCGGILGSYFVYVKK